MEFYTVGVYASTEELFFNKLKENGIDTFCDIRQRRGVRGKKYSFVNSNYLQIKLKEYGIKYLYIKDLSPTSEIRDLQKAIDKKDSISKSARKGIGKVFEIEYKNKILSLFDFEAFLLTLKENSSQKIVLFCVEEYHEACHRSIVANDLHLKYNYFIKHL
jgi:uncharacterized protein (DUF488 family)